MFSSVTLATGGVEIGAAAEALIYYGNVNIVVNAGALYQFTQQFGVENVLSLIDMGALRLTFEHNQYGVVTNSAPLPVHSFSAFSLSKTADGRPIRSAADDIENTFTRNGGRSPDFKKSAQELARRVVVRDLQAEVSTQAMRDCLDQDFLRNAISDWLGVMAPEYELPLPLAIETLDTGRGLAFGSNLNYDQINKFYHRRISASHSSVTASYLLANILGVRKEIVFGAEADSDLWVGPGESAILRCRIETMARRATSSRSDINLFHDVEFKSRTFREAIQSGQRSPRELVKFLQSQETIKFKAWLGAQKDDARLIKEYDRAVFQKTGWTQRLPFKIGKLVSFAGIGTLVDLGIGTMGLATLASAGLSAASDIVFSASDEFVLSKMLKGWRPNQFVEGAAQAFVADDEIKQL